MFTHLIDRKSGAILIHPAVKNDYARGAQMAKRISKNHGQWLPTIYGSFEPKGPKMGVASDIDWTLLPTNETKRLFYIFGEDPAGNIYPFSGLALMGIHTCAISGNTTEYVSERFTNPYLKFISNSPEGSDCFKNIAAYALNGGHVTLFDKPGLSVNEQVNSRKMIEYNERLKMNPEIEKALEEALIEAIHPYIKPLEKPLIVRSGLTTSLAFTPILQERAHVQVCVIGVVKEARENIIDEARKLLPPQYSLLLNIQPGGEYSIDGAMKDLQKIIAGKNFKEIFDLDFTLYFGDAVYKHGDKEGNDYSMVHNPGTLVLAVNNDSKEVPKEENVCWLGKGPLATKAFLTWLAIEKANHMLRIDSSSSTKSHIREVLKYINFAV